MSKHSNNLSRVDMMEQSGKQLGVLQEGSSDD